MLAQLSFSLRVCTGLAAALALGACGSLNNASQRIGGIVTPYKVEVVQGNFVSKEQVEALRPGLSRAQVRDVLGTPLVTSVFHADRYDYAFSIRRQGADAQAKRLAVFFKGDMYERHEGDAMPTEAEFVASLDSGRSFGKAPALLATPEQLKAAEPAASSTPAPAAPTPAAPVAYPPLEAPAR
jgi:outer membrane protein assembly factor BamE